MIEIRSQLQSVESQRSKIEAEAKNRYEGILSEKLHELREMFDSEARQYKDETDGLYGAKVEITIDEH